MVIPRVRYFDSLVKWNTGILLCLQESHTGETNRKLMSLLYSLIADKLIGVHCTHGLNRTGFLVCRYMIEEMKMTADEAISCNSHLNVFFYFLFIYEIAIFFFSVFEDARGHKIKRENYLNKLKSLTKRSSPTLDSDSNSGESSPSRHITERRISNGRSRRPQPFSRPSLQASPSDNRSGNWRQARPPSPTSFSNRIDRYQSNRHIRPNPYAPQNGNWRDPSHHYASSRPMHFNAPPNRLYPNQREPNRPDRTHPSNLSRYTWRRDHHL